MNTYGNMGLTDEEIGLIAIALDRPAWCPDLELYKFCVEVKEN